MNFTLIPTNITPSLANTFGSIPPIHQPIIIFGQISINPTLPVDLPQQPFNTSINFYI